MFWVRFRKNSGHARGRGSGVVSFLDCQAALLDHELGGY